MGLAGKRKAFVNTTAGVTPSMRYGCRFIRRWFVFGLPRGLPRLRFGGEW
jgi:hypothetical protein